MYAGQGLYQRSHTPSPKMHLLIFLKYDFLHHYLMKALNIFIFFNVCVCERESVCVSVGGECV